MINPFRIVDVVGATRVRTPIFVGENWATGTCEPLSAVSASLLAKNIFESSLRFVFTWISIARLERASERRTAV
jgi:hypothetical protein